jgi:DNA segregation ATPase FtsK/SpoIIIE-like protein
MASDKESMNFLDEKGAEVLEGNGDMIYKDKSESIRVQTPLITYEEQKELLNNFSQTTNKLYPPIHKGDDLYGKAMNLIEENEKVYPQLLTEKLNIDYYRAVQLLEMIVEENDSREELYGDAKKFYEEDKNITAAGLSKKLKIHYAKAMELLKTIKEKERINQD